VTGALVLGLDLGTGGARALCVRAEGPGAGEVVGEGAAPLRSRRTVDGGHEQDPREWIAAARLAVAEAVRGLDEPGAVRALCVDGTSGSVVGVGEDLRPVTAGLMYDDARGLALLPELEARTGEGLGGRGALARLAWLERERPDELARAAHLLHQADLVAADLRGATPVSDWSNALKTGFDAAAERWLPGLDALEGLRPRLPEVVAPGAVLGPVAPDAARELGLPPDAVVVAGCTDGTAGFLASGASAPGEDAVTLGTTLVLKRVADHEVTGGGLYSHRLPGGLWLPGAACGGGGGWVREDFAGADLAALDAAAEPLLPGEHLAYPGRVRERFPFVTEHPVDLGIPLPGGDAARFAALLQGTALLERLALERMDALCGPAVGAVRTTGGGARSDTWTQLRADATGRTYLRPVRADAALGAAVLAASAVTHGSLAGAAGALVRVERRFEPDPGRAARLAELHGAFVARLVELGHLER
jgi:sugar (pentulose or hexulose) kinase